MDKIADHLIHIISSMEKIGIKVKPSITIKRKVDSDLDDESIKPKTTISVKRAKKQSEPDDPDETSSVIEDKYKKLKHLEHVLLKPEMYVGSIKSTEDEMFVYDEETSQMVKKKITFVPGLYKLYDEGLVNMRDHHVRMVDYIERQAKIIASKLASDPKIETDRTYRPVKTMEITVDVDNNQIIFKNDGDGIDVAWHSKENMYVPELIFGNLLSGTNFDQNEKKIVGGQNGYGAKLINVLSTEFIIETVDASRGLKYTQRFTDNMSTREEPTIVKCRGNPYTQISFRPDLKRFGLKHLTDNDTVQLMRKRAYDLAACTSKDVTVYYNGDKLSVKTFERYVDLYIGSRGQCKRIYSTVNPDWEIAVCASPDNSFEHVSFINGICTYRGGKHVDHAANIISGRLQKYAVENKKGMKNISQKSVKDNMWLFINATMVNPRFDTQTKEYFIDNIQDFRSKCDVDEDFIVKLAQAKVGILEKAVRLSEFKVGKGMKKSDGKKVKRVKNPKAIDAIYAGDRKESKNCVLILTEGDSAKSMACGGLTALSDEERKHYGLMPLRGKIVNPKDSKLETIEENREFIELKKILGLQQGSDYSASTNSLRYGRVILMTDADVDGDHIKGLGFNLFHEFWPSLLKIDGYFCSLLTPIVKATHNASQKVSSFYSLFEYEQWKRDNEQTIGAWSIKYYKGLATHDPTEAKELFRNMKLQKYSWNDLSRMEHKKQEQEEKEKEEQENTVDEKEDTDDLETEDQDDNLDLVSHYTDVSMMTNLESFKNYYQSSGRHPCDLAIELAFSKKNADYRKGWITAYLKLKALGQIDLDLHKLPIMSYYDFINEKLIDFSVDDNIRSIPNLMDGLKPSQRKVLYAILRRRSKKDIKVNDFAGEVSTLTSYHHGEQSLHDTIIGMAQDFTGSNNINLLLPKGQFGSRIGVDGATEKGIGKDSGAPRYIQTNINPLTRMIFNSVDENLYHYLDDDGTVIEPVYYVPTIPMVLINGARGIGTGWSTEVPCYDPKDVITNVERYLKSEPLDEMQPWYRGFRGTIVKTLHQKYKVTGVYRRTSPTTVEVTEIPVGSPTQSISFMQYKNYIESLIVDESVTDDKLRGKQILSDAEILIGDKTINCVMHFQSEQQLDELLSDTDTFEKQFKLSNSITTSNMNLFNAQGIMTKYINPEDILTEYCNVRLNYYTDRKNYLIIEWEKNLLKINEKIRFITYMNDDSHELKLQKKRKAESIQLLEKYEFAKFATVHKKKIHTTDHDEDDEEEIKVNYDYLLKMPINSVIIEQIEKLQKEKDSIQAKLNELRGSSIQQMWSSDLGDVKKQMIQFEKDWNKAYAEILETPQGTVRLPKHLKKKISVNITSKHGTLTEKPTKIAISIKKDK